MIDVNKIVVAVDVKDEKDRKIEMQCNGDEGGYRIVDLAVVSRENTLHVGMLAKLFDQTHRGEKEILSVPLAVTEALVMYCAAAQQTIRATLEELEAAEARLAELGEG